MDSKQWKWKPQVPFNTACILQHPNPELQFVVEVDVLEYAVGTLFQLLHFNFRFFSSYPPGATLSTFHFFLCIHKACMCAHFPVKLTFFKCRIFCRTWHTHSFVLTSLMRPEVSPVNRFPHWPARIWRLHDHTGDYWHIFQSHQSDFLIHTSLSIWGNRISLSTGLQILWYHRGYSEKLEPQFISGVWRGFMDKLGTTNKADIWMSSSSQLRNRNIFKNLL